MPYMHPVSGFEAIEASHGAYNYYYRTLTPKGLIMPFLSLVGMVYLEKALEPCDISHMCIRM